MILKNDVVKEFGGECKENNKSRKSSYSKNTYGYETRPRHLDGDFYDFGYFAKNFPKTKLKFQKEFIELFGYFQKKNGLNIGIAQKINVIIAKYCNDFEMRESESSINICKGVFYNIMTPFYDDIENSIKNTSDDDVLKKLEKSKEELNRLIYNRHMLAVSPLDNGC